MKLWDKGTEVNQLIESFTIGKDREMDLYLAPFDVLGTMAHTIMLEQTGLLPTHELRPILNMLKEIYNLANNGEFFIEEGVEDVHSQVEMMLTRALGDLGKKVHSGRSRNDQVLLDIKLFIRHKLQEVVTSTNALFAVLQRQSESHKHILMPGYTHLQLAMPSSFGLWFGAFAESLADDMEMLLAAWNLSNQNPLGAAAGYGSSFPLNRTLTTNLLGFKSMNYNVIYAQMGRGKTERNVASALSSVAYTLGKLAMDGCLYASQNFAFIKLPDELTTGSSIMPHKKNPDVFELIRAKCNKIQALPQQISMITGNLPTGYFRDMQIIKEMFLPAFDELISCIDLATFAISNITVSDNILNDDKYSFLFSVEEVNKLVLQGIPFRDAYKLVGTQIANGTFKPEKSVNHTHEGSIGNLCTAEIKARMVTLNKQFDFEKVNQAIKVLVEH